VGVAVAVGAVEVVAAGLVAPSGEVFPSAGSAGVTVVVVVAVLVALIALLVFDPSVALVAPSPWLVRLGCSTTCWAPTDLTVKPAMVSDSWSTLR
jgi:hypothetical protein